MKDNAPLITIEKIATLHEESNAAQQLAADAITRRDQAVLLGVESGLRPTDIANRLSITPGRVSQIVTRAREARENGGGSLGLAA